MSKKLKITTLLKKAIRDKELLDLGYQIQELYADHNLTTQEAIYLMENMKFSIFLSSHKKIGNL
jgi:hypothetical protein